LLAPVVDLGDIVELLPMLDDLAAPTDVDGAQLANWQADLSQLDGAWTDFDRSVDRADLTWSGFKLHCSRAQRGDDLSPGIRLLTVHKSQGREYPAVAVMGMNDGQFPDFRARAEEDRKSELRTFYVAITRPRRVLLLTRARVRETRYGPRKTEPSPFLQLIAGQH